MKFRKPIIPIILTFCVSLPTYAQRANDSDLAQSALEAAFRTNDPTMLDQKMVTARADASEKIDSLGGAAKVSATIVFSAGKTSAEVQVFVERRGFELIRAEAKSPIGDSGRAATISVGGRNFLLMRGTIAERIDKSIGVQQLRLGASIQNRNDEDANLLAETAYSGRLLVYTIEVIGDAGTFENVVSDKALAAVILDPDNLKVANYEMEKQFVDTVTRGSAPPIRRRLEDGPPPGVDAGRIIWIGVDPRASSTRQ